MAITTTQLVRGQSNINNAFAALTGKRSEIIAETNLLLVSSIVHAHEHGDVTVLNAWATAFPAKSTSNAQVMAFIKKFAPAKWVKADSAFKLDKNNRVAEGFTESELGQLLLASSYHDFMKEKKEKVEKVYNADLMAWNAVKSLEASFEKQGVALSAEALAHLNAFKEAVKRGAVDFTLAESEKANREKALKKFA
ncbi:hypothetical protein PQC34_gp003 [Cronobacter phage A24]|uniref:Uncharacterized protein n=1 Tax=Cronobacter phage A24 TaxID=2795745 RepID=A0A7T5UFF3_9CAUD|nr:hypothetical protein PQC34_gp003 [Cronobacter phage A24]QQG33731.1 hypothetical protein [Cronobacter phage A24]